MGSAKEDDAHRWETRQDKGRCVHGSRWRPVGINDVQEPGSAQLARYLKEEQVFARNRSPPSVLHSKIIYLKSA